MRIANIKPIPKYIIKLIRKADIKGHPYPCGNTRFYSYLTKNCGELVKVTVAVRHKYKEWYCKQVAVHGIDSKLCFVKDMLFTYIAGYTVGWHDVGISKEARWYEFGWGESDARYFDPYAPIVNPEYALSIPEFKYSAVDKYGYCNIFKYLRLYRQYPEAEYIVKMGLQEFADSKMILQQAKKDKSFRKWLFKNKNDIALHGLYVETILTAYKSKKPIQETQRYLQMKKSFVHDRYNKPIAELFKDNLNEFFIYCAKQNISFNLYRDYLIACEYLKLDMTENKNRIPHDFKHWHDIRIDQYRTAKEMEEQQKKKALYDSFESIAKKYIALQYDNKAAFVVIIAKSPSDLKNEGNTLHHCVGSMNFDQKFIREESLIFFVRNKDNPETPFVTIEYSLKNRKLLQCYGIHNTKPTEETMTFINKKWLPYARKQLKQIA